MDFEKELQDIEETLGSIDKKLNKEKFECNFKPGDKVLRKDYRLFLGEESTYHGIVVRISGGKKSKPPRVYVDWFADGYCHARTWSSPDKLKKIK